MDNDWEKKEQNRLYEKVNDLLTTHVNSAALIVGSDKNEQRKFETDKLILESLQFLLGKKDFPHPPRLNYISHREHR